MSSSGFSSELSYTLALQARTAKNRSLSYSKSNKYKMSIILSGWGHCQAVQVQYGLQMVNYARPATDILPSQATLTSRIIFFLVNPYGLIYLW